MAIRSVMTDRVDTRNFVSIAVVALQLDSGYCMLLGWYAVYSLHREW